MEIDFGSIESLLGSQAGGSSRKRGRQAEDGGEPEPEPSLYPAQEPGVTASELVARMRVTSEEALQIEHYEQGTEQWLLSRRGSQTRLRDGRLWSETDDGRGKAFVPGRLTASNFGTAVGHNKYSSANALVEDMLWGTVVSNAAMRYGNEMEPVACEIFETAMFFLTGGTTRVEHRGLLLDCPRLLEGDGVHYEGWCGVSPDGFVHFDGPEGVHCRGLPTALLEIKCPSGNTRNFYSDRSGNERFGIPHYYYDQIQGIMGLRRVSPCFFVVYLPDRTQITLHRFNEPYFEELFSAMRRFWFEKYLPSALACARGELIQGEIVPRERVIEIEDPEAAALELLRLDSSTNASMEILLDEGASAGSGEEEEEQGAADS
jgi:hypothetical protein